MYFPKHVRILSVCGPNVTTFQKRSVLLLAFHSTDLKKKKLFFSEGNVVICHVLEEHIIKPLENGRSYASAQRLPLTVFILIIYFFLQ